MSRCLPLMLCCWLVLSIVPIGGCLSTDDADGVRIPDAAEAHGGDAAEADGGDAAEAQIDDTDPDAVVEPGLEDACFPGSSVCDADGLALHACGYDATSGTLQLGGRIPCRSGNRCLDGACTTDQCVVPDVLFVVDRSDSMASGGRWAWVSETLAEFTGEAALRSRLGLRMFPSAACSAGAVLPPEHRPEGLGALLTPPAADGSTPLGDAVAGLAPHFGDPGQGEAVVLISDGDETCDREADHARLASELYARGVQVFTIAVSTEANAELLDEIASYGGGGYTYAVDTAAELATALDTIYFRLGACACTPGSARCAGGADVVCEDDGSGERTVRQCPYGCSEYEDDPPNQCLPGLLGDACQSDADCGCVSAGYGGNPSCDTEAHASFATYELTCANTSAGRVCTHSCASTTPNYSCVYAGHVITDWQLGPHLCVEGVCLRME